MTKELDLRGWGDCHCSVQVGLPEPAMLHWRKKVMAGEDSGEEVCRRMWRDTPGLRPQVQ